MFQYTGEYIKAKGKYGREFYTFTPMPLCNGIPIIIDDELLALLATAHNLLGTLDGLTMYHPDADSIKELMCLKECWYSLQIDDKNRLSFRDVLKEVASGQKDMGSVPNLVATHHYIYGKSILISGLLEVYRTILYGTNSKLEATIRNQAIPLGNVVTNLKTYSPTAPEHIMGALNDIIEFISIENHTDIFVKTAMAHYQFEMIHPFENCNGFVGRILVQMILLNFGYKGVPYMCLSEYLHSHKEEYFDKLSSTQMGSGYVSWIKFFVWAVCYAADQAVNNIKRFTEIALEDEKQVAALAQSSKYVTPVYNYFKKYLISEIKPIAEHLEISYNTAAKVVKFLVSADILQIEHEQSRHKVFRYYKAYDFFDNYGKG